MGWIVAEKKGREDDGPRGKTSTFTTVEGGLSGVNLKRARCLTQY